MFNHPPMNNLMYEINTRTLFQNTGGIFIPKGSLAFKRHLFLTTIVIYFVKKTFPECIITDLMIRNDR